MWTDGRRNIYDKLDTYKGIKSKTDEFKTNAGVNLANNVVKGVGDSVVKTPTGGGYNYGSYGYSFKPSKAYTEAMAYTNSLLEKLSSGRTSVSDKIDAIMGKIENRPEFSYDFNTDPLFQNALASAMSAGQTAMQDTIGQASALTGGYGSSYATSAANQAYNASLKGAYDSLPQYYNIARDAYDREGEALNNQLAMYRAADESEYARLNNAYTANVNAAEAIYNKDWNTANYNRQVAESNANLAYKYAALAQDKAYNDAKLAEEKRQFNESKKTNSASSTKYKEPSETQMKKALEAYEAGGDAAVEQLLASLPSDIDVEKISDYVHSYGKLPYSQREYTMYKDTRNWGGGLDNNDVVRDPYDTSKTYTLKELAKLIAEQEGIDIKDAEKLLEKYNGRK